MQDDEARYRALCDRIRAWHQEQGIPLEYPPATEQQVRETEAELGAPLPPLLRMIYTEVANGGNLLSPLHEFFGVAGGVTFGLEQSISLALDLRCPAKTLERMWYG